ncbi:alpha/beta hydrolase [Rossellomorea marisflavi]|uniref:alpha/beta hydrolase n=1 Tax=Rossellomorea marisflavi TaxID=189381 RepID=UPI00345AC629
MNIQSIQLSSNPQSTLTAYSLDTTKRMKNISIRPAVLILPGGGYYYTSDREAEPVAMAYLSEGYHAFILRYSVGEDKGFEDSFRDAEEALAYIRNHASESGVDPERIAVVGFSAGGHLAASLGTMGTNRPRALILGYPCILSTLEDVLAFPVPSLEEKVDGNTPPSFLFSTFEDQIVPVEHTVEFIRALTRAGVPFESHIFQHGVHGLSLGKPLSSAGQRSMVDEDFSQWFQLSISWLHRLMGDFPLDRE